MPLDNRTCFRVNLRDHLSCVRCRRQPQDRDTYHKGFEYHHVLPRSAGGPDALGNIVLLCHTCHLDMHGKAPAEAPTVPAAAQYFACHACTAPLAAGTVAMNCGWYRCAACQTRTHLFDHFGFAG